HLDLDLALARRLPDHPVLAGERHPLRPHARGGDFPDLLLERRQRTGLVHGRDTVAHAPVSSKIGDKVSRMESDEGRDPAEGPAPDVELVRAVARGDRSALAALYDRYSPIMLALALRIVRERREAEDLLHDVFLEVWRTAKDYDPDRGRVRTWLTI